MASSRLNACIYDVFLSFGGEDTRHSFTDHLYHRLLRAGIYPFRDNEDIKKGEELKPEIETAIKKSKGSIVVLSKNYATSTWCLDELQLILEQRKEYGHFVLPIFYDVEPTDVRKQIGSFAIEVKPCSRWTDDNVKMWTAALNGVAGLSGEVVYGVPETSIIEKIVKIIYDRLGPKDVHLSSNIIGMDIHYEEINSWYEQFNLQFLAIYGMGGSGKTTLAKYVYNLYWKAFEYVSFVDDIGSRCENREGLLKVQKQLLNDLLGGKGRTIPCVSRNTFMINEALKTRRALIVLDDIVKPSQLVDLLGTGEINAESKIIITTRVDTDEWPGFLSQRCRKYKMRLLNDSESSKLLCRHAFTTEIPKAGFQEVVRRAVLYCGGNPLALEVLGSSLYENNVEQWASQLRLMERDIDDRVQKVIVTSYESLPTDTVKGLFLHIACFFNGIDEDYVVKILEGDYSAKSGIKTLTNRCLLSVSPNKKLMMHRLVQDMGKNIVRREKTNPAKRSRVWLSSDSYRILRKGKGSKMVEGLALDMKMLLKEDPECKSSELKTDALKNMDRLKLLQLNFVELSGSYDGFSKDIKWLCWPGFHSRTIPSDLYMRNLVAIDMSCSKLDEFEPPMDILSLKILNLKDSQHLVEIRNFNRIPNLETLVLWNCCSLDSVCETIKGLKSLALLNMTGCKNLFNREQENALAASASGEVVTKQHTFSLPSSLHRLFLKDCHLNADSFPLSFSSQPALQYLNLGNSLFENLPSYNHLIKLLVLDLSFCSKLKKLCLPDTLAELYVFDCWSLEEITFQSHRFTLQEFGYEGCINLNKVESFFKLLPISKLDETHLRHMKWLKEYQNHMVYLVGDEITVGRSRDIQMLYEFNIMSTSLPDTNDPNLTPEHMSKSASLSFYVPQCPKNKTLEGINATFKYALSGEDWAWFCKVSTSNGVVDLMYNPKVFGKPEVGEVCIWLSYWPIGSTLNTGDEVKVSIVVMNGLEVHECGVSLVYSDQETTENNMGQTEFLGVDLSAFKLSSGAYYLCRRDFLELTEVRRLTPDWFRTLVGDTIDYAEVRGWRKTGQLKQVNDPSVTELKFVRCILHGPQVEDIYKIAEMSKSSFGDKTVAFSSSLLESEITEEEIYVKKYESGDETYDPNSPGRRMNPATGEGEKPSSSTSAHPCRLFSLAEIQSATDNFSDELVIGQGRFGRVYKGQIFSVEGGHVVAIKRLNSTFYSLKDTNMFRAEIDTLCYYRHRHLVSVIGYCDDNEERILVYEYMPNGTLYHHLHEARTPLSWMTRLKIAVGIARGLDHLHQGVGTQHGVIHRNLKSSNILVDENWEAVISGFELSIIGPTQIKGTFGYLDTEYFYTGKLTRKSDVYSFGVILFELISGRRAIDQFHGEERGRLVTWAQKCIKERKLDEMVDSNIKGTISAKCLRGFAEIADHCVHDVSKKRPTMSEVIPSLQALLELEEKSNLSADSSDKTGFPWNILKYFIPATKPNFSQPLGRSQSTSGTKTLDNQDKANKLFDMSFRRGLR